MKTATKRNVLLCLLTLSLAICCCIGLFLTASTKTASAASNTNIQTLSGTEQVTHQALNGNATTYSENYYHNTGIKFYSPLNTNTNNTGNEIKVDSNALTIDFSNAYSLHRPANDGTIFPLSVNNTGYTFQILSGSVVKWYATFTRTSYTKDVTEDGTTTTKTFYKKTININGKSTVTTSESSSYHSFVVSDFGTNTVNLSDGAYTIKITSTYSWVDWKSFFNIKSYNSTTSLMGYLTVDTTAPTITMKGYSSGNTISNGAITNERVTFTVTDSNHSTLYYKMPTSANYVYTTSKSYTSATNNGMYYVYAVDAVGNKSAEYSFYYDNTNPAGSIYSNGTSVASGSYVSKSFSYSATDSGSGIAGLYFRTPTSGTYQPYSAGTIIPANAGDGWYYFYAVDKAGNASPVSKVYLETAAPLVEFYRNGELAFSTTITNSGTFDPGLYLKVTDKLKIVCNSENTTCNAPLNTDISFVGTSAKKCAATFRTPTGITSTFYLYVVHEKPKLLLNGLTYTNGATIYCKANATISYLLDELIYDTADTGMDISAEGAVNDNTFIKYSESKIVTLSTPVGTTTTYYVYMNDRAGNVSGFRIIVDKELPVGTLYAGGSVLADGGYTNKSIWLNYTEAGLTVTYTFNGSAEQAYTSGTVLSAEGVYKFFLTDRAGNTNTYTATIDKQPPIGKLYADYEEVKSGTSTSGNVFFTWDGDATATVNGASYTKNKVISQDGYYRFVLTDKAGNSSVYTITIDKSVPSYNLEQLIGDKAYKVAKWYVAGFNGETVAFGDYTAALEWACEKELTAYGVRLELKNLNDFTQYQLVASKGNPENDVRVGPYWKYKSQSSPKNMLFYFDEEYLHEVVAQYAKQYISEACYYTPGAKYNYGRLESDMYDNMLISESGVVGPCVNNYTFENIDSEKIFAQHMDSQRVYSVQFGVPFGEQFSESGVYIITEVDEAGNNQVYYVILDKSAPTLKLSVEIVGESIPREIDITEKILQQGDVYYYKSLSVVQITDNDPWTTLQVKYENSVRFYTKGDELPVLNNGGEYVLMIYDRNGNSYSFTVYIVGNEPSVTFTDNYAGTAFDLSIKLEYKYEFLVSLEIYRNGELLPNVSANTLYYSFDKAGLYTVILKDNYGRIIEHRYEFNKTLPQGNLIGVENEGRTSSKVYFEFNKQKYYAEIIKDGIGCGTDSGGLISVSADGLYEIKLVNISDEENFQIYRFEIDATAPTIELDGCESGKGTNSDVTVKWQDQDVRTATYTINGGKEIVFENGSTFTAEGKYIIKVVDDIGNRATVEFTIDKTAPTIKLNGIQNGETKKATVTITNLSEQGSVEVYKDGKLIEYKLGDKIKDYGSYEVHVTDEFGNQSIYTFTLAKKTSSSLIVVLIIAIILAMVVTVIYFLKNKKKI